MSKPVVIWLVIATVVAYGYSIAVIAALGDWPWIAAAFAAPLWATMGAGYAQLMERERGVSNQERQPE